MKKSITLENSTDYALFILEVYKTRGRLLVNLVPMLEQRKTMRKGTFVSSWAVRSDVIV